MLQFACVAIILFYVKSNILTSDRKTLASYVGAWSQAESKQAKL